MHPTVKPVALVADAIKDCSKRRGEIVLDVVRWIRLDAHRRHRPAGRRARVLEYDPLYCDTIVRRWQTFTGKRALHAASGGAFEDVVPSASSAPAQPRKRRRVVR
jgi:hypothetical protein